MLKVDNNVRVKMEVYEKGKTVTKVVSAKIYDYTSNYSNIWVEYNDGMCTDIYEVKLKDIVTVEDEKFTKQYVRTAISKIYHMREDYHVLNGLSSVIARHMNGRQYMVTLSRMEKMTLINIYLDMLKYLDKIENGLLTM
jgi:hypothetical protein